MTERGALKTSIGHFNNWCLSRLDRTFHRVLGQRKRELFSELPENIVEIGPGLGANFRYYAPGTRVLALEPSPFMHDDLRAAARRFGHQLELVPRWVEKAALPEGSVDAVVGTLVLCSVRSQEQVLREILRMLRPGGRYYFLEHVAAPSGSFRLGLQTAVARPWRVAFEGCEPHRRTRLAIEAAGFGEVVVDEYLADTPYYPVNTQISGYARK